MLPVRPNQLNRTRLRAGTGIRRYAVEHGELALCKLDRRFLGVARSKMLSDMCCLTSREHCTAEYVFVAAGHANSGLRYQLSYVPVLWQTAHHRQSLGSGQLLLPLTARLGVR